MAPDRKRGYGLMQQIGRYEFWAFDVEQNKLLSRTPFAGRPRMALRVSSNGKLLYIYQAGATIDVYDAATYKLLRTIEMNADQTTNLFILPQEVGRRPAWTGGPSPISFRTAAARPRPRHQPDQHRVHSVIPYLTKDLVDNALVGRDLGALRRIVCWFVAPARLGFVLNVVSGLRYTRVSAEILFDMRLALYEHLQRLSPRFYARTRLGDIVSRINNDISEIQRIAAEAALAWVGNVLFLAGSVVDDDLARLAARADRAGAAAGRPGRSSSTAAALESRVAGCVSGAPTSAAS